MTTLFELYEGAHDSAGGSNVEFNEEYILDYAHEILMDYSFDIDGIRLILECHNNYIRIIESDAFNCAGQDAYWHLIEKPLNDRENEGR